MYIVLSGRDGMSITCHLNFPETVRNWSHIITNIFTVGSVPQVAPPPLLSPLVETPTQSGSRSPWWNGSARTKPASTELLNISRSIASFHSGDVKLITGRTKFTTSGAHDVTSITSPQKNDLCTEELRDRA